ncbi:hypothetical protein CCP4SC76_2890001 [Gammaproteobacteria bacterium]
MADATPPTDPMTALSDTIKALNDKMDTLIAAIMKSETEDKAEDAAPADAQANAEVAALKAQLETAEAALKAERAAARHKEIVQLATHLAKDFTDSEKAAFVILDDATFNTMSTLLTSSKPSAPAHLFREQATHGQNDTQKTLTTLNAELINQLAGKKP